MNKKGIELSVNVIIIAAISLIVLVLLAYLVLNAGQGVAKGTTCEQLGGSCVFSDESCGDYAKYDVTKTCAKAPEGEAQRTKCCIQVA